MRWVAANPTRLLPETALSASLKTQSQQQSCKLNQVLPSAACSLQPTHLLGSCLK